VTIVVAIVAVIAFAVGALLLFSTELLLSRRKEAREDTVARFEHLGVALLILSVGMMVATF